jgi:hypothetical protein
MNPEIEKMNEELKASLSELENVVIKAKGFDIKSHFMSDRQIAKKMMSIKMPTMSDDDLNLLIFGQDLKKIVGPSYEPYVSDNEIKLPSLVSTDIKSAFKAISSKDPLFDEVDTMKTEMRNSGFLLDNKLKDIKGELIKITTLIINSIPAMIQLVAPPSFNVSGAISILMLSLGSLTNLQIRIKEVVPLLAIFKKIEYVVKPDNFLTVSNLINTTVKALVTVSKSVSALSVISEAKQKTLDTQQKLMDGVDTKLKALNVSNFETTVDFDAAKKSLESQKETISKTIEKALK